MTLKNNYKIYRLKGANIFHLGSLSSNNKALEKIKFYDIIFYSAIDQNFIKTEVYNRYKNKVDYYFDYGDCIYKSLKKYKIIAIISFLIMVLILIIYIFSELLL